MPSKYILQYGSLAGWPYWVAAALRELGYASLNVIPETQDVEDLSRQLPHDRALSVGKPSRAESLTSRGLYLLEAARSAAVVHYHGSVIMGSRAHPWLEGNIFERMGIPMLMSFGGTEARIIEAARERNPYFHLDPNRNRDEEIRLYLSRISQRIKYAATDYEMATYVRPYFEKCFIFRQPVDTEIIQFNAPNIDRPPTFLHIPTNTDVKGTTNIVEAANRLHSEGFSFEFRMKRQLTQRELYNELAACDVYVDELRCGAHGVTAVEAMAAGKPVLTYIREDIINQYPEDLPIISTNPDSIYRNMRKLLVDRNLRRDISLSSRAYAEKYHNKKRVAQDLLQIYEEIGVDLKKVRLDS